MHNQNEELFMTKKKKPSFAEWTLQNGVNLNQTTPKPLTLGEVAPKATERVTSSASTTTKPQTRDPFLEGFHSTDDKSETERKTYLQHRTPAVDRVSPETKKPEPVKLPYRPSVQGPPKVTKLPYVPQKDGTPKMTQYRKQTAPAYDSPVKIVGDNVTQKDYEDFWEAFRNEGTGDKLNWMNDNVKKENVPTAYLRAGQPWMSSATETDDYRKKAGREYAKNIIDDLFFGDSNLRVGDYPKVIDPVTQSKYREILENESYSRANAEYLAGLGAMVSPTVDATKNSIEFREMLGTTGVPHVDTISTVASVLGGIGWTLLDKETIPGIINTHNNLYEDNNARKQYGKMLDYIEGSDYKYLVDWDESREKYIEDLQKEVEKLESAGQLGYLPPGENEIFKEEAINALKRIIYLNQNYDTFSKRRDQELSDVARAN